MNFADLDYSMFLSILPELSLLFLAGLVMLYDLLWPESRKRSLGLMTATGLGVTILLTLAFARPGSSEELIFGGMLRNDWAAFIFRIIFMFSALITSLISLDVKEIGDRGAYFAILLIATLGMNLMGAAADLIMIYLAIETASISLYLLAGYLRGDDKSTEAGIKYFLFGAFTSTVMLYGFSLIFGFTGETDIYAVAGALATGSAPVAAVVVAAVLVLVGFGFKVAAVPFHFWAPDVYEGAPTPITAYISVASKAAGFAVLVRVMLAVFPGVEDFWAPLIAIIATFTMTLGNTLALAQRNIKRMLAYSSIAQAGYALVGVAALSRLGIASVVFYLMMYAVTNVAAFAVVTVFARVAGSDEIADYAGLSRRAPGLALAMLVALLSLGGMPPMAGFVGKFYVFAAAVDSNLVWLAVVGVLNAIIGLYYYLSVLKVVYLYRSDKDGVPIPVPRAYSVALSVCVAGILVLGTFSGPWFGWAMRAAEDLF